jgi:hypothetical protein
VEGWLQPFVIVFARSVRKGVSFRTKSTMGTRVVLTAQFSSVFGRMRPAIGRFQIFPRFSSTRDATACLGAGTRVCDALVRRTPQGYLYAAER